LFHSAEVDTAEFQDLRLGFGDRSFAVAGPQPWTSLHDFLASNRHWTGRIQATDEDVLV